MNLKEAMQHEALSVFLNPDEFGQPLIIDGVLTVGIWDDSEGALTGQSLGGVPDVDSFGLAADQRVLHIPAGVILPPVSGQRLNIDGDYWTTTACGVEHTGLLELRLSRVHA